MSEKVVHYDTSWTPQQLCDHLIQLKVISNDEYFVLKDQRIDGLTFLLMNERNFTELGFLLGPKIKIMNFITNMKLQIKTNFDSQPKTETETGGGDLASDDDHKNVKDAKVSGSNECSICGKIYSKAQYVKDHIRTTHHNIKYNYSCRVCGQAFSWRVSVLKHIKKSHPYVKSTTDMIEQLF